MLTEQQKQERLKVVTGSDASTILGVNPYTSILDLYMYKTGLKIEPDISHRPHVRAGSMLEEVVGQMFEQETFKKIIKPTKMFVHSKYEWMAGNIDGLIEGENAIIEIKTASRSDGWGEQGENVIPKHYLCQVAHYLAVTNAEMAYVAVLIGGWDFRWYRIQRSKALEQILIEKEKAFWFDNVLAEIMPEPRNMDDVINKFRNDTLQEPVVANSDISMAISNLRAAKRMRDDLNDKIDKYTDEITVFMGANDTLLDSNGNVAITWKAAKDSIHFDSQAFMKQYPKEYNAFLKVRPGSRRFLIKGEK